MQILIERFSTYPTYILAMAGFLLLLAAADLVTTMRVLAHPRGVEKNPLVLALMKLMPHLAALLLTRVVIVLAVVGILWDLSQYTPFFLGGLIALYGYAVYNNITQLSNANKRDAAKAAAK